MNISLEPLSRAGAESAWVHCPVTMLPKALGYQAMSCFCSNWTANPLNYYLFFVQEPLLRNHWPQKTEIGMSLFISIIWLSIWHDLESPWRQSSTIFTRSFLEGVSWGRMTRSKWEQQCLLGRALGPGRCWCSASCLQFIPDYRWHGLLLTWSKYFPTAATVNLSSLWLPLSGFLSQQKEKKHTTSAALFPIVLPPPPLESKDRMGKNTFCSSHHY